MNRIYLDHAATTPLDEEVLAAMLPYFSETFGNADSPHFFGRKAMAAVDRARDRLAELLGASPEELYFTCGGTEADNWAIKGFAKAAKKRGKSRVLISAVEHHAVSESAKSLEEEGFSVGLLPVNEGGMVEANALREALDEDVGLVAVMWANNETGAVQEVKTLSQIAKQSGALFFTDAVQAAPYLAIDLKSMPDVDGLSISAHKFHGPKGVGALYVKRGVRIENFLFGGEQERGKRGGTLNVAGIVGLAAAYEKTAKLRAETNEKLAALKNAFLQRLQGLPDVVVNGKNTLPSLLNLQIAGVENATLLYDLDLSGVAISAGAACASGSLDASHALLAMGLDERQAKSSVRVSFGRENTVEEAERAAEILKKAVVRLRGL